MIPIEIHMTFDIWEENDIETKGVRRKRKSGKPLISYNPPTRKNRYGYGDGNGYGYGDRYGNGNGY